MNAADSHETQRHGYNAQNGRQGQDEDHQPDPEPVHSSCTIGTASFVSAIAGCSGGTSDTSDRNTAVLKQFFAWQVGLCPEPSFAYYSRVPGRAREDGVHGILNVNNESYKP